MVINGYKIEPYANLYGANLYGANLRGAKGIFVFSKLNGRTCFAVIHEKKLMIKAGCFWGSLLEFDKKSKRQYPDNSIEAYEAQIAYLRVLESQL